MTAWQPSRLKILSIYNGQEFLNEQANRAKARDAKLQGLNGESRMIASYRIENILNRSS